MSHAPLVVVVVGLCASRVAAASPPDVSDLSTQAAPPPKEGAGDGRTPSKRFDADELLASARQQYQSGNLKGAVGLLRECYGITHDPNLLFNIAQVYRELNDCLSACEHYEQYVEEAPDGERVADASNHIATLRLACPGARPHGPPADSKAPPTAAPALTAPPTTNYWSTVAWISLGTSVVAAAASTYFGVESYSAKRDVERIQQQTPFDARYLNSRLDDFYRDRSWATGAAIASGVTLGLGIYALIANVSDRRRVSVTTPWSVLARGDSVDLGLRF